MWYYNDAQEEDDEKTSLCAHATACPGGIDMDEGQQPRQGSTSEDSSTYSDGSFCGAPGPKFTKGIPTDAASPSEAVPWLVGSLTNLAELFQDLSADWVQEHLTHFLDVISFARLVQACKAVHMLLTSEGRLCVWSVCDRSLTDLRLDGKLDKVKRNIGDWLPDQCHVMCFEESMFFGLCFSSLRSIHVEIACEDSLDLLESFQLALRSTRNLEQLMFGICIWDSVAHDWDDVWECLLDGIMASSTCLVSLGIGVENADISDVSAEKFALVFTRLQALQYLAFGHTTYQGLWLEASDAALNKIFAGLQSISTLSLFLEDMQEARSVRALLKPLGGLQTLRAVKLLARGPWELEPDHEVETLFQVWTDVIKQIPHVTSFAIHYEFCHKGDQVIPDRVFYNLISALRATPCVEKLSISSYSKAIANAIAESLITSQPKLTCLRWAWHDGAPSAQNVERLMSLKRDWESLSLCRTFYDHLERRFNGQLEASS